MPRSQTESIGGLTACCRNAHSCGLFWAIIVRLSDNVHIENFFADVRDTHVSGVAVKETSYYPYLSNLLTFIGKKLKPKVRCIIHPRGIGAGLPDGALITAHQKCAASDPLADGLIPSRGVIEMKAPDEDVQEVIKGEQVAKYLSKYGLVVVTNLRQFVIVSRIRGEATQLEAFTIASSEKAFWKLIENPRKLTEAIGESFNEYLTRVLLQAAPLTAPKEVAWFLASYARDAKARIEGQADLPGLATLRTALEEALGLKFTGEEGEHFFRSSLVQTLFYGVFSAWVLWCKRPTTGPKDKFNWHEAAWSLHVPMIKTLFEQLATPTKLQSLGLEEVLNWTQTALNRVERTAFLSNFEEHHAVQYFYEPFLAAYDPVLRKRLGVWFTPPDVVRYMVARIDKVLREQLHVTNGFADPNVFVLDPCCGTGAFLVEVLRQIEATLRANGGDALTAEDIKTAAMERVFGFELLPAPFVVSHLQLGLLLQNLGAPLSEQLHERVGVYLTNALTGWNPDKGSKQSLMFPEMEEERDAAELVKRDKTILVVLGNPPYYAFAGVSPEEEQGLVEPYKEGLASEWKIRKYNLDELYVRFLRLAERRIAEMSKRGIVCYISSYSYLSDPSFVVVRKRLCEEFNYAWLDCLNGDSRETGKLTPDGRPDPSIFSTEYNREGIRLGTSVGLFAKTGRTEPLEVRYREFWGTDKRVALLKTLEDLETFDGQYEQVKPVVANRFSFRPSNTEVDYASWPAVVDLAEEDPISGLQEMRRGALMAYDKEALHNRMTAYFDPKVDWMKFAALETGLSKKAGMFEPEKARTKLLKVESFDDAKIMRYALYPFDYRWCFYSAARPLWNRPRPELLSQRADEESFFVVRRFAERPKEGSPAFFTAALPDYHLLRPNVVAIPLRLRTSPAQAFSSDAKQSNIYEHLGGHNGTTANLSEGARQYLSSLTGANPDEDEGLSRMVWYHALAVLYSPLYLAEHASAVRANWPRIPLPAALSSLQHSAELGIRVGQLLDMDCAALGVTTAKLRKELNFLGRVSGPQKGLSLAVTAGWGHSQKEKDIVMPGRGIEKRREFTADEKNAIAEGAKDLGLQPEDVTVIWGSHTLDVHLNNETFWSNVPEAVWEYAIGGYQVLKKWLSYRERQVLGRDITKDEAREFTQIVRRIAALLLLQPELDANYAATKIGAYSYRNKAAAEVTAAE